MVSDTELGPSPSPSPLAASAAPVAPPTQEPPAEPARQPGPEEGAVTEGETPEGTETPPEQPAWAGLSSREEVLELPEFKEHVSKREESARDEGRSETHRRMQPFLERQTGHIQQVAKNTQEMRDALLDLQDSGNIDVAELNKWLRRNSDTIAALNGVYGEAGKWAGVRGLLQQLSQAAGNPELVSRFDSRINEISHSNWDYGDPDPHIWGDMFKAFTASAVRPVQEKLDEAHAKILRLETENNHLKRNGQPVAAAVTGTAGGAQGPSPAEYAAATAQQRAEWRAKGIEPRTE